MIPYGVTSQAGSDPDRVRQQVIEDRLNADADREHEAIQKQADKESKATHNYQNTTRTNIDASNTDTNTNNTTGQLWSTSITTPMKEDAPLPTPPLQTLNPSHHDTITNSNTNTQ